MTVNNFSVYRLTGLLLSTMFALLALFYSQCGSRQEKDAVDGTVYFNHNDTVKYVGIETCARCHMDKVNSFLKTGMGQSIDFATKEKSAAKFGENAHVYDRFLNYHYRAFWKDSVLFIAEYRLDEFGDTTHYRHQKIDYIIGSGQHTNSHLFKVGDFLFQAPMTWYSQDAKWDLPPGFEDGHNSRFSRQVDVECISCHNAMPVMAKESDRAFMHIGNGINCERCHGPGELHVRFRMGGGYVPRGHIDSTIVNPSDLPPDLQIDVCQRCHLQGNNVLQNGKSFTSFRPGMRLKDYFEVYSPEYQGEKEHFNMADHSERMQMSKCYQSTRGTERQMTCITCHDPHVSVKETGTDVFNNKCRSCHNMDKKVVGCTETMTNRMKANDNCVKCHMPLSGSKDIPHVSVHDHRIGIHDNTGQTTVGKLKGLYAVNNDNPGARMKIQAYLSYYEKFTPDELYLHEAEKMLVRNYYPDLAIHLYYLKKEWYKIITIDAKNENSGFDAMTHYRVGKAYSAKNNRVQALVNLQEALKQRKDIMEFYNELGVLQLRLDYLEEATATFENGLRLFPNEPSLLSNAGFSYYLRGDRPKSHQLYKRSLQLNPDHLPTLKNMAQWYLAVRDIGKVRLYLRKVLILDPGNKEALYLLKELDSGGEKP